MAKQETTTTTTPKAKPNRSVARSKAVEPKPKAKAAKATSTRRTPGVIASIEEFLRAASGSRPLSKASLCDQLAKRFPERQPKSMMSTINVQISSRLKADKGIVVRNNARGFWIDK